MAEPAQPVFEAHLHPETLSDLDLETLREFGVEAAVAVAHHTLSELTAKGLLAHFDELLERQLPRLETAGIRAWAALGVHPLCIPRRGLGEVMAALPGYFRGGRVIALGEVGFHRGTEVEEDCLALHLSLARSLKLRVVVHTPVKEKEALSRRTLALLKASGLPPEAVLFDHVSTQSLRAVLACGHYAGLTLRPDELSAERAAQWVRKLGAERMVLDSNAGDVDGDLLALPRAAHLLVKAGLSASVVARATRKNAMAFYRVE